MSISKFLLGICVMIASVFNQASAAPSVKKLGMVMQKSADSSNSNDTTKARVATTGSVRAMPISTKTTSTNSTVSAATPVSVDSSRLVGVPLANGKASLGKPNTSNNTNSAAASTVLKGLEKDFEKLQNDYVALQNNYVALQNNYDALQADMSTTAEEIRAEATAKIVQAAQEQQSAVTSAVANLDTAINQTINRKFETLETKVDKKADTTEVASAISTAVTPLATKQEVTTATENVVKVGANGNFDTLVAQKIASYDATYNKKIRTN